MQSARNWKKHELEASYNTNRQMHKVIGFIRRVNFLFVKNFGRKQLFQFKFVVETLKLKIQNL